ncbi:MAG TPA: molybdopterin-dependent oxidoreductase [Saprospiraceae bacterium]|nr:molybdopterin-dependent oxidoreductase [Saprospiraceae bacterium]HPN70923.1 molybdopterin-dependent oxidoreductase [Saprospiraceae bacterium]
MQQKPKNPSKHVLNRREFIELSGKGIASLSVGAAGLGSLSLSACESPKSNKVFGACHHDCPDTCSWEITSEDNQIKSFKASESNPYTAGKLCNKMDNFHNEVVFSPHRLLKPLKRVGVKGAGDFAEISWDQALQEISEKLKTILNEKGGEAILPFSYGGNEGIIQGQAGRKLFAHMGASRLDRTICGDAAVAGIEAVNGQTTGVMPEDIIHSRFIVLWGTNTLYTNQHLWPFILKAKEQGAKIVVIDPFKSDTAMEADWFIQPLPGTDTALAMGLIHVILAENLQDVDYISKYTSGINELTAHVQKYNPENVAKITGLDKETIIDLAKSYANAKPSLIRLLIGMEHQSNGASAYRAIAMLPALTGAWKELGGGLMHMAYELFGQALNYEPHELPQNLKEKKSRLINMVQLGKALTDPKMSPSIDALFVYNANPAVTIPNQNLVLEGLKRTDLLTVVLDHFVTDTARYADYVFPATTPFENWDLFGTWAIPYLNINEPAIPPLGEAKPNTAFFRLLAKQMGYQESYLFEDDQDLVKATLDSNHPYMKGITFNSLRKTGWAKFNLPDPWMPHVDGNFSTPTKKCLFYNPNVDPALPDYVPLSHSEEDIINYPYRLLSIKSTKHFLNSSHANIDSLIQKEGKPYLDISDEDAIALSIVDGDAVKVYNQRGEVLLNAKIKKRVKKGVVCMPQGYWPSLMHGNSSANALTDDLLTDMGGGAALQEARVAIMKV